MKRLLYTLVVAVMVLAIMVAGCGGDETDADKGPITIGSKIDTEGALLAQIIILMLEDDEFEMIDRSSFGPTSIVRNALLSGEIDMYPEYTGNGQFFFDGTDPGVWKDAEAGYELVKELDGDANDVVWLQPAPADNTWAIAIPEALAQQESLSSLDDFATYVNGGGYVKLAGSEEFVTSPAALPAFQDAYGFTLSGDQLLTLAGGNTAQTEKAAAEGTSGVNAAMAYGTDGSLAGLGLLVLTDTKGVQPVYAPAPIVRGEVLDQYAEIEDVLAPVFLSLDLVTLQTLNAKIQLEGQDAEDVAREYLTSEGFLE
jgi:osmoprotectant transport system substrate-binding protein